MFEIFQTKKDLKRLKDLPLKQDSLGPIRARLEDYLRANPVMNAQEGRRFIMEGFNLLNIKSMPALIIALIVLLGGGGLTFASQNSLPGDKLYPVKTLTEEVRTAMAFTPEAKKEVQLDIAKEKLDEVQALLAKKGVEPRGLDVAISSLEKHMNSPVLTQEASSTPEDSGIGAKEKELRHEIKDVEEKMRAARKDAQDERINGLIQKLDDLDEEDQAEATSTLENGDEATSTEAVRPDISQTETAADIAEAKQKGADLKTELAQKNETGDFQQYDFFIAKADAFFAEGKYFQADQAAKQAEQMLELTKKKAENIQEDKADHQEGLKKEDSQEKQADQDSAEQENEQESGR